jgi:hypothetical protein
MASRRSGEQVGLDLARVNAEGSTSGKIDLELGNGEVRTIGPGTCVILGGVAHAWKNHYDEPCILACVMLGTDRSGQ